MAEFFNGFISIIERLGNVPIKWLKSILSAFENHPKTLTWIAIIALVSITESSLPFIGVIIQEIKTAWQSKIP